METMINEIFYSLQMEGSYIGYPAIFVRFSRCNLNCDFCDTKYALTGGSIMDSREIYDIISRFPCRRVIFTGGEPALYDKFMAYFIKQYPGFEYFIETNGTIFAEESIDYLKHIVVSPKFFAIKSDVLKLYKKRAKSIEFKFIVDSIDDIDKTETIADKFNLYPLTLQPLFDNGQPIEKYINKTQTLIEAFKESGLSKKDTRLIMQNHKVIYKEKRGV